MDGWWFVASATEADLEVVRATAPLAVDLFLDCGPLQVPIAVSATRDATLEHQDTEPARVLRSFLNDNPWEGMGSVTSERWMLLARGEETMVFGQREGEVGLGQVVTMGRRDIHGELRDRFRPTHMAGCRPVLPGDNDPDGSGRLFREQPVPAFRARIAAQAPRTVRVSWANGRDLSEVATHVHARTEVLETPTAVHILLISAPNPDYQPPPPGHARRGTGRSEETAFELAAPLGTRALLSDYGAPATEVEVEVEVHDGFAR